MIVGAGLAGAALASQLARRGWQVQVLDAADTPAAGASGLPAGLVVPHVSPDDNLLARATRAGAAAMWDEARALLEAGQDYALTGVRERLYERGRPTPSGERWHAQAGWIKPEKLIRAWLQHGNITWRPAQAVAALTHDQGLWQLRDRAGQCLAQAAHVALCAGFGTQALLPQALPMQALRGQLSWDWHSAAPVDTGWPDTPVNGAGNLIAHVPTAQGAAWYLGSSFVRDDTDIQVRASEHQDNLARLHRLAPEAAQGVAERFQKGQVQAFCATRCAARDRMPIVGPAPGAHLPGLWVSTAMGARGLSLALLSAQILAAQMCGEVAPVETAVQRALASTRRALQKPLRRA